MDKHRVVEFVAQARGWSPAHAEGVVDDLVSRSWGLEEIYIGFRANFRCEYCDRDLLESVDAYKLWEKDHIVPGGPNGPENLALACLVCNCKLKNKWVKPDSSLVGGSREQQVEHLSAMLRQRRAAVDSEIAHIREVVRSSSVTSAV